VQCADSGVPEREKLGLTSMSDLCEAATEEDMSDPSMRLQNTLRLLCTTAKTPSHVED